MKKLSIILTVFLVSIATLFVHIQPTSAYSRYYVNPYKTYTYTDMQKDIGQLQKAYPGLVKVQVIGKTHYGRSIYAVSLGYGKSTVLINSSHHAREWLTTNLTMNMIDKYACAYKNHQKLDGFDVRSVLNGTTLWFIPMVNPDGVTLQQFGYKAFPKGDWHHLIAMNGGSKNFKHWKANAQGVDLNRQYNAGWHKTTNPNRPSYANYSGTQPEQAPETRAVLALINRVNPEMEIAYHSMGRIIYWNYKQSQSLMKRNHVYAAHLAAMTHYTLISPYGSGGMGLSDWFMYKLHRPGFTIEIGQGYDGTNLPVSQFTRIWKENQAVGLYLAAQGHLLYLKSLSEPLKSNQIQTQNNLGINDHVSVSGIASGDEVRLFNTQGKLIAEKKATGKSVMVPLNLGSTSGKIGVSVTRSGKRESTRTTVAFKGEASQALMQKQVQIVNAAPPTKDSIRILNGLKKGDVLRVYNAKGALIGTGMAQATSLTLEVNQLGVTNGSVGLTIQHPNMEQSARTMVSYAAEPTTH